MVIIAEEALIDAPDEENVVRAGLDVHEVELRVNPTLRDNWEVNSSPTHWSLIVY